MKCRQARACRCRVRSPSPGIFAPGKFDRIILFSNGLGVALAAWLAGIPQRIGYDRRGRGIFLTAALPPPRERGRLSPIPAIDYYLALVQTPGAARPPMMLTTSGGGRSGCRLFCGLSSASAGTAPIAILNNNCGAEPRQAFGPSNLWPPWRDVLPRISTSM